MTAAPAASVRGDTATVSVNAAVGNELVRQAVENGSESVVIAPSAAGSAARMEVSIPASTVGEIGSRTGASLTVSTPAADVTIPNGALSGLAGAGGTVTVAAGQRDGILELTVTAGGETAKSIPGGLTLTVPVSNPHARYRGGADPRGRYTGGRAEIRNGQRQYHHSAGRLCKTGNCGQQQAIFRRAC